MNHTRAFKRKDDGGRWVGDGDEPHKSVQTKGSRGQKGRRRGGTPQVHSREGITQAEKWAATIYYMCCTYPLAGAVGRFRGRPVGRKNRMTVVRLF